MCALSSLPKRNAVSCVLPEEAPATAGTMREPDATHLGVGPESTIPVVQDRWIAKVVHSVEADPHRTIHDCAMEFSLSDSHFRHQFTHATGLSLGRFMTEHRLQHGALLLVKTRLSIKEIACAVGYEHTSSFTRAFVKRFDMGPRRYRMENSTE